MAAKLIWTPQARADLIDIYLTIGLQQPQAAERYLARIEQKAALLVDQPRLGVRRPEIHPAARMLIESPYVLLYEPSRTPTAAQLKPWRSSASSMAGATS